MNLAENAKTPQFQQSASATKASQDRTKAGAALRGLNALLYTISRSHVDLNDRPAVEKKVTALLDEAKTKGTRIDSSAEALLKNANEEADRTAAYEKATAALVKACQPKPHHFAVTKQ